MPANKNIDSFNQQLTGGVLYLGDEDGGLAMAHAGCCAVIELVSRASLYGSYIIEKNGINSKQPANNEESHLFPDGFRSIRYGTIFI